MNDEAQLTMQSPLVVGLGEILWDLLPGGKVLGGAPANFAYHAAALGARGAVVSAVGADALGTEILDKLSSLRLNISHVNVDPDRPTGTVAVRLDGAGVPSYVIHEGVAWDYISQTDSALELARRADVVCFGTLGQRSPVSRATIRQFLASTRPEALRVFDINLRQHFYDVEVIRESLANANMLKLNDQELPVVAHLLELPPAEQPALTGLLAQFPLNLIALTRGPHGSSLYTRESHSSYPGVSGELVDTVGAGDAFTAALVMGWFHGHDLDRINATANRVASYVCSQPGATPPMPPDLIHLL
jgi:fructokinase